MSCRIIDACTVIVHNIMHHDCCLDPPKALISQVMQTLSVPQHRSPARACRITTGSAGSALRNGKGLACETLLHQREIIFICMATRHHRSLIDACIRKYLLYSMG